ncbi:MAG: hypothetical protein QXO37_09520 [Candidatus Nitrosocaldaceae archaeon]
MCNCDIDYNRLALRLLLILSQIQGYDIRILEHALKKACESLNVTYTYQLAVRLYEHLLNEKHALATYVKEIRDIDRFN